MNIKIKSVYCCLLVDSLDEETDPDSKSLMILLFDQIKTFKYGRLSVDVFLSSLKRNKMCFHFHQQTHKLCDCVFLSKFIVLLFFLFDAS